MLAKSFATTTAILSSAAAAILAVGIAVHSAGDRSDDATPVISDVRPPAPKPSVGADEPPDIYAQLRAARQKSLEDAAAATLRKAILPA